MNDGPTDTGGSRGVYARRQLEAIAARWDARADSWDHALEDPACHLNEDDAYNRFIRVVQKIITDRQGFCALHGVIDAGCGTGLVLAAITSAFAWGIGIDISPKMIEAGRAKNLPKITFLLGDCFDLASLCPPAGAVISRGVLLSHYGRAQGRTILESSRAALVPGGFVVFDFLNEAARTKHHHAPENKTWFTAGEIESLAREAGFSRISILGEPNHRVLLLLAGTIPPACV